MREKLLNLLSVKNLVTIILSIVFAYLSVKGKISSDQFITIFTVVISFYFGTKFEEKDTK